MKGCALGWRGVQRDATCRFYLLGRVCRMDETRGGRQKKKNRTERIMRGALSLFPAVVGEGGTYFGY
jgi:hypothetical protein